MKQLILISALLFCSGYYCQDSLRKKPLNLSGGLSISPQMIFIGALDAGPYLCAEFQPFRSSNMSFYSAIELRNKWLQLPLQGIGFNGKGLRTYYSVNALLPVGMGYTFRKESKSNALYLIAAPVLFTYKDRVKNKFFLNTVSRTNAYMIYGLCWTNTKISKKGRVVSSQFFIPVGPGHFLENLRNMSIRFGWSIERKRQG